jgi:hypothetical protein
MSETAEHKIELTNLPKAFRLAAERVGANAPRSDLFAPPKKPCHEDTVRVSHLTALWCAISILGDNLYVPIRSAGDDVMNLSVGGQSLGLATPEKSEVILDFEWQGPVEYADYSTRIDKEPGVLYIWEELPRAVLLPGTSRGLHFIGLRLWENKELTPEGISIELPFWLRLKRRIEGKHPKEASFDEALRLCLKHAASRSPDSMVVGEAQWREPGRASAILSAWLSENARQAENSPS